MHFTRPSAKSTTNHSRTERTCLWLLLVWLALYPFLASPILLDLANQVLLASVGAIALMLLTGFAGQVSLGHAGLLAAGAFTAGITSRAMRSMYAEPSRGFADGGVGTGCGTTISNGMPSDSAATNWSVICSAVPRTEK